MRTPQRITPVTTGHFTTLPYIPQQFQPVRETLLIDRIRYWIETAKYNRLHPHLGLVVRKSRTKKYKMFKHRNPGLKKNVLTVIPRRNPFAKVLLIVDDPTENDQKVLLELFQSNLMPNGYGLNEVEIAIDLQPDCPERIPLLKKWILGHLALPYARKSTRPSGHAHYAMDDTWYLGSKRNGPRTIKVYEKRIGEDNTTDVLRLEVTLHGRFDAYGIPKRDVINLETIKLEKSFQWRRFDLQRAAELALQRDTGKTIRTLRKDQWIDITLAPYRSLIEAELSKEQGPDNVEVLGQMMARYRELDWWRPQDMAKVFPPLVPAASHGDEP